MLLKDIADQMLEAYADLGPEQQLEVLIRVWEKEQQAGRGMGKAMLLAILIFEAMDVPKTSITPESLVIVVQNMREMADRMTAKPESPADKDNGNGKNGHNHG